MDSIWIKDEKNDKFETLDKDIKIDTLIIGGGIFGITSGYLLTNKGRDVAIIERKENIGFGISGHTTAKITSQHGAIYNYLKNQYGLEFAKKYFEANEEAISSIENIIKENNIDCDFEKQSNFIYSITKDEEIKLKNEFDAVSKINKEAVLRNDIKLPFETRGAIEFPNQAMFNPYKYIKSLANKIIEQNGEIFVNTTCYDIDKENDIYVCKTENNKIYAKNVVIATHYPFLNIPGFYFSKIYQSSSYVIALSLEGTKWDKDFDGMYINIEKPIYSFRKVKFKGENLLLLGGGGHKTGEMQEDEIGYKPLIEAAKKWFPDCKIKYKWSANDCISLDKIPYIGEFSSIYPNVYVGTGFKKWGMTSSYVAAKIVSDKILEKENKYEDIFKATRTNFFVNRDEVKNMVTDTLKAQVIDRIKNKDENKEVENSKLDTVRIIEKDGEKIGVYIDENGKKFAIKPVCTHLGCILSWNQEDRTWDCPCHGSRFNYKGEQIENPAIKDLEQVKFDE